MLEIFDRYTSDEMTEAFTWFYTKFRAKTVQEFQKRYPLGSEGRKRFYRIANLFDLMGTFLERKYLPRKMILDFCPDDVRSCWKAAGTIVVQMRKKWNDPSLYKSWEFLKRRIDEHGKWRGKPSTPT